MIRYPCGGLVLSSRSLPSISAFMDTSLYVPTSDPCARQEVETRRPVTRMLSALHIFSSFAEFILPARPRGGNAARARRIARPRACRYTRHDQVPLAAAAQWQR